MEKEKMQNYDISVIRVESHDYYIQADSHEQAAQFLRDRLQHPDDVPLREAVGPNGEFVVADQPTPGAPLNLVSDNLDHRVEMEAKGLELNTGAYVVTHLRQWQSVHNIEATSPERATDWAVNLVHKDDTWRANEVKLPDTFLSCPETERVILGVGGRIVDMVGEDKLKQALSERYPDGVDVRLMDDSIANLRMYANATDEELNDLSWNGLVDADDKTRLLAAMGGLEVTLHLKPEDYGKVYADENTYYNHILSDMDFTQGEVATSLLLSEGIDAGSARIEILWDKPMLEQLTVEGIPFRKLLEMADERQLTDDHTVKAEAARAVLKDMPEWKTALAHSVNREEQHRIFITEVAPGYHMLQDKYAEMANRVAKEHGFESYTRMMDDVEHIDERDADLVKRIEGVLNSVNEYGQKYQANMDRLLFNYYALKDRMDLNFIRSFDKAAREQLSSIRMTNHAGRWEMGCKIDGVYQMARPMSGDMVDKVDEAVRNHASLKPFAAELFKAELAEHLLGREQTRQMKI